MKTSASKLLKEFEPNKRYKFSKDKFKEDIVANNYEYDDYVAWAVRIDKKEVIVVGSTTSMYYLGNNNFLLLKPEWCVPMKNAKVYELDVCVDVVYKHTSYQIVYSFGHHFIDEFTVKVKAHGTYNNISANYGYAKKLNGGIDLSSEPRKGYKPITAMFLKS